MGALNGWLRSLPAAADGFARVPPDIQSRPRLVDDMRQQRFCLPAIPACARKSVCAWDWDELPSVFARVSAWPRVHRQIGVELLFLSEETLELAEREVEAQIRSAAVRKQRAS